MQPNNKQTPKKRTRKPAAPQPLVQTHKLLTPVHPLPKPTPLAKLKGFFNKLFC